MRKIMKITIYWAIAVMTVSTAFAQAQAGTFQNPKIVHRKQSTRTLLPGTKHLL